MTGSGFLSELTRRSGTARDVAEDIGRRVTDELRHRGGRAEDTRAELARLWRQVEDLVENRATPAGAPQGRAAPRDWRGGPGPPPDTAERLRDAARARPLLAIGIAVAATLAITSLIGGLGRRR